MTTGSRCAAARSAPAASVTTATAPFSAAARGELRAVPVDAADGDEDVARAQVGGREREPGERHARGLAAHLDAESGGEVVERVDGRARPGGARGAGSRARQSAWRIHPLIRTRSATHARTAQASQVTANSKAERGYGGGVEVIAFVIGVVLLVVGLAVSIALHELGHLLAREEVRRARRAVHDRLRPDALVAAPRRDRSTGSRRSRSAATSRWRACTRPHPREAAPRRASQRTRRRRLLRDDGAGCARRERRDAA